MSEIQMYKCDATNCNALMENRPRALKEGINDMGVRFKIDILSKGMAHDMEMERDSHLCPSCKLMAIDKVITMA